MNGVKKAIAAAALAASFAGGAAATAWLIGSPAAAAPTPSPSSSTGTSADSGTGGTTFHSNEDPAHEQGESAAREAQENAGQRPTVP